MRCPHPYAKSCRACRRNAARVAQKMANRVQGLTGCVFRSSPTGEGAMCLACGPTRYEETYRCLSIHGRCHPTSRLENAQTCMGCPQRVPHPETGKVRWVSTAQLAADSVRLASLLPPDCSGVVGVPRSGMIPASIIATHRHLPLYEFTPQGPKLLSNGTRGYSPGEGTLAVVDDTVYGGYAMSRVAEVMRGLGLVFNTAAVYVTPFRVGYVDYHADVLAAPHVLEWNALNNGPAVGLWDNSLDPGNRVWAGGLACDFDGILCEDPPVPDADGGTALETYRKWILNAKPKLLARRRPLKLVVTGRIEQFRAETLAWLEKHGMQVERLVMHPARSASERDRAGDVARMKGLTFGESPCGMFLESDARQCEEIFHLSGKPVICPAAPRVWQ